jgi:hypothetical protein
VRSEVAGGGCPAAPPSTRPVRHASHALGKHILTGHFTHWKDGGELHTIDCVNELPDAASYVPLALFYLPSINPRSLGPSYRNILVTPINSERCAINHIFLSCFNFSNHTPEYGRMLLKSSSSSSRGGRSALRDADSLLCRYGLLGERCGGT